MYKYAFEYIEAMDLGPFGNPNIGLSIALIQKLIAKHIIIIDKIYNNSLWNIVVNNKIIQKLILLLAKKTDKNKIWKKVKE